MNKSTLLFWRKFLLTTLLVTVLFAIGIFTLIFSIWDTWTGITKQLFPYFTDEMISSAVLDIIAQVKLFIWLILACPAIALHILIKRLPKAS